VKTFEFRLIPARRLTDQDFEALFEAGFDDTVITQEDEGTYSIGIRCKAPNLVNALVQALKQCEQAGVEIAGVVDEDLVTLRDIAERTDQTYESVRRLAKGLRGPGGFPPPLTQGACAYYSWVNVSEWFDENYDTDLADETQAEAMNVANRILRARHLAANPKEWAPLLA
jgi:hypothetical protein